MGSQYKDSATKMVGIVSSTQSQMRITDIRWKMIFHNEKECQKDNCVLCLLKEHFSKYKNGCSDPGCILCRAIKEDNINIINQQDN
jgi:hypothetical protein